MDITAVGGRINLFGGLPKDDPFIRFAPTQLHYKGLIVTGTTACSTYDCLRAADIVNSGRLDLAPLITALPWPKQQPRSPQPPTAKIYVFLWSHKIRWMDWSQPSWGLSPRKH
ncbi:hypothetical protein [Candidatus Amarobacter glycogenicus]|uniref:hypothetical protein n=1 Tax=Candidatus Amarobacter glycogenicus TaxID=3140699 RepID=UPI002A0B54B9|nr:hypothetical protein [Dehalococcoidia bacterium]